MIRSASRTPASSKSYLEDAEGSWLATWRMGSSLTCWFTLGDPQELILKVSWRSDLIWPFHARGSEISSNLSIASIVLEGHDIPEDPFDKLGENLSVVRRIAIGLEDWVTDLVSGLQELTHYVLPQEWSPNYWWFVDQASGWRLRERAEGVYSTDSDGLLRLYGP